MNLKNRVGIIGCGWLGLPLAKSLIKNNYIVYGSTTNKEKLGLLANENINPFFLYIEKEGVLGNITEFLENLDVLIINIPPKNKNTNEYSIKIRHLSIAVKESNLKKVLFISSTGVYGTNQGKIDSYTIPKPSSQNGTNLLEAEKIIINNFSTTILRLGGLIGPDRNPTKVLSTKKIVYNPNSPVNLIHLTDCIGIIKCIIKKNKWGKIYLGVSPYHPSRESYYNSQCIKLGLNKINFSKKSNQTYKEITDKKIAEELGYGFKNLNLE